MITKVNYGRNFELETNINISLTETQNVYYA